MMTRSNRSAGGLLAALALSLVLPCLAMAQISVEVSANVAPPELPVYDQPPIPGDGYLWVPGYWAWGDDEQDYYWVPGTWIQPPQPEYLWTPGFWAVSGALFLWHAGYWGPHVGFYGGVNYGYGYGGNGYEGGYWQGGRLYYNRSVNNVSNVNITNVYNKTVVNNVTVNRVSYNGGNGVHAEPTPAQLAVAREHHVGPTQAQQQHVTMARSEPQLRASQNQGHPPIAATPRAGSFHGADTGGSRPTGNMSVIRENQAPDAPPRRPAAAPSPPPPREAPAERPTTPRAVAPPQRPEVETRPPVEQRHVSEPPPRTNNAPPPPPPPHPPAPAPEMRPNPPHAAEHPPERDPRDH